MKTSELLIAVNTVCKNGGTHGSPVGPLLHGSRSASRTWAALGQSPAPPADGDSRSIGKGRGR